MHETKLRYWLVPLAAAALLAVDAGGGKAEAANVFAGENDAPSGDKVFFTPDGNFDITPFVWGQSGPEQATGFGQYTASSAAFGSAILYVTEGNANVISDTLEIRFFSSSAPGTPGVEGITATWTSDTDIGSGLGAVPANVFAAEDLLVENGTIESVPSNLWVDPSTGDPVTIPSNITFQIQSDANDTATVPEPASFALLSVGLIGVGALCRRRTR